MCQADREAGSTQAIDELVPVESALDDDLEISSVRLE
jgi:hypothetical protein